MLPTQCVWLSQRPQHHDRQPGTNIEAYSEPKNRPAPLSSSSPAWISHMSQLTGCSVCSSISAGKKTPTLRRNMLACVLKKTGVDKLCYTVWRNSHNALLPALGIRTLQFCLILTLGMWNPRAGCKLLGFTKSISKRSILCLSLSLMSTVSPRRRGQNTRMVVCVKFGGGKKIPVPSQDERIECISSVPQEK